MAGRRKCCTSRVSPQTTGLTGRRPCIVSPAMKAPAKVGLVVAGYIAAVLVASLSTWVYIKLTDTPERELSAGMYGFGDSMVFLAVFGLAAVPAASLALFFLRQNRWFLRVCSPLSA